MAYSADIRVVEENIISLLKNKDQRGMEMLYDTYGNVVYGFLFHVLQSDELAEEALEAVFLRAWRSINTLDSSKQRLFTWIIDLARQSVKSKLKFDKSPGKLSDHSNWSEHYNPDAAGTRNLVKQLDKSQRKVLEEIYFKGIDFKELVIRTVLPANNLKTMVRSVLKMLQITPLVAPK